MEALLFAAARSDHVEQVIRPAVEAGKIVLCDRFLDSSRVYQGVTGNLDPAFMRALERIAINGMMPDMTLILDVDPEEGPAPRRRAPGRRDTADRFEKEALDIHAQRREAYLAIAAREPDRCIVIDASADPTRWKPWSRPRSSPRSRCAPAAQTVPVAVGARVSNGSRRSSTTRWMAFRSRRRTRICSAIGEAASRLATAYRDGKLPHALLLAGPPGIGKATLAYHLAHHLLFHPDAGGARRTRLETPDPKSPLLRQIATARHPSVLHLTRPWDEKNKRFKTVLSVDEIRRVGRFLSLTSHDGGYRVVVIDPADDMNTNAANALLKNLEEPPARTLFIADRACAGRAAADHPLALPVAAPGAARRR